jgi:signal transduction histidine kinase
MRACTLCCHDNLAITELDVVAYLGIPLTSPDGQTLGSLCVIDTRAREWTAEEIDTLQELAAWATTEVKLRVIAQQLHAAESLRDDLTHMIVHDLRTPLTALLNGVRLIKFVGELNEKQQDVFHLSVRSGNTLLKMINDLLDVSKMESGPLPLEYAHVSTITLLNNAMQQVQALATSKGLTLTSEVAPGLPAFLADEDKMLRTLVNLLSNAIKFTPQGGFISLSARLAEDEQGIVFAVSDTGEGIPQSELEHVFDKFAQVETRISGRKMSTGLGLTFCKLTVEAHGGRIWIESEVGKGSTFLFCIPIEPRTHVGSTC